MTHQELQTRALQRAKAEHLKTWKIAGEPGYLVRSRLSEPGAFHRVAVSGRAAVYCTCLGWQHRQSCTHAAAVQRRLAREDGLRAVAA